MAEKNDYIKREDAEIALGSMSMLDGKIFVEDALAKISSLPTIEVCEDCISRADLIEKLKDYKAFIIQAK